MKRIFATLAITATLGLPSFAQTTQTGVIGASGDPVYALRVEGDNGVIYNCKDAVVNIDGVASRECIRERDEAGSIFEGGDGLAVGAGVGAAAIVVLAIASGSSDTTTTTTTGSGS